MKYMGSKAAHAKDIVPILKYYRRNRPYHEPFVGGANIIEHMDGEKSGADIDPDLISLWQAVSNGWMPPVNFTEEEYMAIKLGPVSPLRGYAAFALSYGGKKFGGWRRDSQGKRDYVNEAYRNAIKQFPKLRGCEFSLGSYDFTTVKDDSLIYCDPPYAGTTKYSQKFDHDVFWNWVRYMSKRNTVIVSEYYAPNDFKIIWEKQVSSSLTKNTGSKKATEKLFILEKIA